MKTSAFALVVGLAGLWTACTNPAAEGDPATGAGAGRATGGKGSHAGSSSGGSQSDAGSSSGGSSSLGGNGQGGGGRDNGGGVLSLASVVAQIIGRNGDTVRFTVKGTKPGVGVSSIAVTFEDGAGAPVTLFDANWDGAADAPDGRIVFDAPVTDDTFTATATLTGVKNAASLAKVKVALVDGNDQTTPVVQVAVVQQAVAHLGEACDASLIKNRCDSGLSCAGTPTKCTAGVAPTIIDLRYLRDTGGPVILTRGTDPDDDMGTLHIEFLDPFGKPVTVDQNSTPTTTIDTVGANLSAQGAYYSRVKGGLSLDVLVAKVRVTPHDFLGNAGASKTTDIASVSEAGDNGTCDARGFTGCIIADVCSPGLPVLAGKCLPATNARATQCSTAPKLDPVTGATISVGLISGASLWDPPVNCTNPDNIGRPEAAMALHLDSAVNTLTISTERPETNVDTVLYLLPGCPNDSSAALGCNDDDAGYASSLTLTNVAAGDYTIVVESGQLDGGSYGLQVTAQ